MAAGIAAAGTWAMGQVAIEYFESGKRLNNKQMRQMYKTVLQRDKHTFSNDSYFVLRYCVITKPRRHQEHKEFTKNIRVLRNTKYEMGLQAVEGANAWCEYVI